MQIMFSICSDHVGCQSALRGLAFIAAAIVASPVGAADMQVKDGDAPFCQRLDHFEAFVIHTIRAGHVVYDEFPDCVRLKAGTRLEVTGEVAAFADAKVYSVTVHGNGGDVDGFTLDVRIEDLPKPANP